VTPDSPAILKSITNKSLMELAADEGMVVERRRVPLTEVGEFAEVAACGTAVVMTAIKEVRRAGR
jgi:branched-chain amino acid aminotransferase